MTTGNQPSRSFSAQAAIRHTALFCFTALAVLSAAYYTTGRSTSPYKAPVDLTQAGPDRFLLTNRQPQRQMNEIKLRYLEKFGTPRVGLFGNHALRNITASAMGLPPGEGFMNLYADHIGIPEIRDELYYLESKHLLPRELILIGVHNPHTSSGYQAGLYIREMPPYVYLASPNADQNQRRAIYREIVSDMSARLDWRNIFYELFADVVLNCRPPFGFQPIDAPIIDQREHVKQYEGMLHSIASMKDSRQICSRLYGYRQDGSFTFQGETDARGYPGRQITGPWSNGAPYLTDGPSPVAGAMREIAAIGARNGVKVAFFIPPVFEEARDSSDFRLCDDLVADVSRDLTIFDHRRLPSRKELFYEYMHPGDEYTKQFSATLRENGLISGARSEK